MWMSERVTQKVPDPTPGFWATKVLTTGMGEALSDFLVRRFDPVPTVAVSVVIFVLVIAAQLRARRYTPWLYWTAVSAVGVVGTMVADAAHVVVGVPYLVSAGTAAVALAVVFVWWRRSEGTVDVHDIVTRRREMFSWAAVVVTFALGTATGDLTASTFHLGYLGSGFLFLAGIVLVALLRGFRVVGTVGGFWAAYVLTRPLGASFADWAAVSPARGGLGLGTGLVSVVLIAAIVVAVLGLTARLRRTSGLEAVARRGAHVATATPSAGVVQDS
jgi:uncharacterized membrane-anchored protein